MKIRDISIKIRDISILEIEISLKFQKLRFTRFVTTSMFRDRGRMRSCHSEHLVPIRFRIALVFTSTSVSKFYFFFANPYQHIFIQELLTQIKAAILPDFPPDRNT